MRYSLLGSLIFTLFSCSSPYKNLQKISGDATCVEKFKPIFSKNLYKAQINILGKELSGILLFKTMPDSSIRVVFSSEMGFKYFDFEFAKNGDFKVFYILKAMNKKVLVNMLKNDFELVLMQNLDFNNASFYQENQLKYSVFKQNSTFTYYITNENCSELVGIENASKHKIKVQIAMQNFKNNLPDRIGISHKNFKFNIGLKLLKN
jgi:hypothetical protein